MLVATISHGKHGLLVMPENNENSFYLTGVLPPRYPVPAIRQSPMNRAEYNLRIMLYSQDDMLNATRYHAMMDNRE